MVYLQIRLRKHRKLIFPHRDFIICIVSLAIVSFFIRILSSAFFHPHFSILILSSAFYHPHFIIRIFPSAFYHPHFTIRIFPSAFCHPHFFICILSSAIFLPHFIIRNFPSAFYHPHFSIRHPPSAIHQPPPSGRHFTETPVNHISKQSQFSFSIPLNIAVLSISSYKLMHCTYLLSSRSPFTRFFNAVCHRSSRSISKSRPFGNSGVTLKSLVLSETLNLRNVSSEQRSAIPNPPL